MGVDEINFSEPIVGKMMVDIDDGAGFADFLPMVSDTVQFAAIEKENGVITPTNRKIEYNLIGTGRRRSIWDGVLGVTRGSFRRSSAYDTGQAWIQWNPSGGMGTQETSVLG